MLDVVVVPDYDLGWWGRRVCGRCGADLPTVRRPRSFRQFFMGGWSCPGCGVELDRVGRPLDEYPWPWSRWLLTQTQRGGLGLFLGGVFELLIAATAAVLALTGSSGWFWLETAFFMVVGTATAAAGAMSWWAHRRVRASGATSWTSGPSES